MKSYISFVLKHRVKVLLLLVLITTLSLLSISRGVISSSMKDFLGEAERYDKFLERTRQFINDEVIIIAIEDEALLSKSSIERLKGTVDDLTELAGIHRVSSILDFPDFEVSNRALMLDTYVEQALASPENADQILADLCEDPMARGLLVSRDGKSTAMVLELATGAVRRAEDNPVLVKQVLAVFEQNGFDLSKVHRTGFISVLAEIMYQSYFNLSRLFPVVCVALLITVLVMFRRLWPVAITGIVALLGVIWTMGFAVLLFHKINLLMAMVPMFIMIIAFADVVHLCSAYLLELSHGETKERAIEKSAVEVGTACFFTSMTTFLGFISLALVPAPISRQTGLALGFGVAVSLLIALTLAPVLFSIMPEPKSWRTKGSAGVQDRLSRNLDRLRIISTTWPRTVTGLFIIIIIASLLGLTHFRLELNLVERFSGDNVLSVDESYFSENFLGTNYIDVFIEAKEKGGLLDPEVFSQVAAFGAEVGKIEGVDKVVSLVDLISVVHPQFFPGQGSSLPADRRTLAQYLFLFEDGMDLDSMIDFDRTTMRVAVHIGDDGILETARVGQIVDDIASRTLGPAVTVEVLSLNFLLGDEFDMILDSQKKALLFAFASIMIMMIIGVRSITVGAWSMIPNLFPLLVLTGYVGWFWDWADTDIIMILLIAIGIGVDDTIHFLMRYRIELERTRDIDQALKAAFNYSGRAIVITSVILVVGFAPFIISTYFTTHMMGTLLPATLIAALLADLMLMPALIKLGAFRFRELEKPEAPSSTESG